MLMSIGGGSLREMPDINDKIAEILSHIREEQGRKPYIMFLPQASFESKPYVNSFVREFKTRLKCKTTIGLWKNGEMDTAHLKEKFDSVDAIYIGGGRYDILLSEFRLMGVDKMLSEFYKKGGLIVGNSAGAMLFYNKTVSDCKIMSGESDEYEIMNGYGFLPGTFMPHANEKARQDYVKTHSVSDLVELCEYEYKIYD